MDQQNQIHEQSSNRNEQPGNSVTDQNRMLDASKAKKMTDWKFEPTVMDLKQDLEYARQQTEDQKTNISGWLDLRNATGSEAPKRAKAGRSAVQPKLIRKHNEWRYPALTEPFLNTDRMFEILPRTAEDVASARQNQILLNWQFDTQLNKVDFIDRYVRTDVDEGTVVVRVGWEREYRKKEYEVPEYEYFPVTDSQQAEIIMQAMQAFDEDPVAWQNLPETLQASVEMSVELGDLVYAEEVGMTKKVEEVMCKNQPSVRIVQTANLFVDPACEGDWERAQYMIYTYEATKSDLKAKKGLYKNLDKVDWNGNRIQSQQGNPDHESLTAPNNIRPGSSDKDPVLVYEYWGLYDIYGNGVMVPIVVTWIGDQIIQMDTNPFPDDKPPFVIVPYMPILGSAFGEADASLLQDNQRIIGAVQRGMIDLMGRSANAQTGYAKGFLDATNKRRFANGEDFEFNPNGDPRANIQQMTYPEIPRSAHETIMAQNQEAEALTGVKSFSGGISGDAYGSVATGIRGALDSAATREMSILRRLAKGMQDIGRKIVAMNQIFLSEKEVVRVTNEQFVEIKRSELKGNFDLKVDISTASVDEQRAQDLGFTLQTVGPDMDPGLRQTIMAKIADLKRMPDLAEMIRNYQPQPDPMMIEMQKAELAKMQADAALDMARAEEAKARAKMLLVEAEMLASGEKHLQDIEKMGAQARGNRDLEVTKGLLGGKAAPSNVEAAVGYNTLTDAKNKATSDVPPTPPTPMEQQMMGQPTGAPDLGSGYSDPNAVPPQFDESAGQPLPIGPLSSG